ncbi:aspartate--tRNA(Asn) ligase [Clostridium estertheticum]|uniref:aspartate--tRNA(Asn) ligase n=1 Tax=Clostridium estertheticum TaxID=238834 RepID=UPI0013E9027B|nr:aspartate--tRNA(Asn) ligase [Clostridium estertheticum]MBZ9686262.1 aspartate--tRNA(Asn) ligase [Clostridium estertheticum]
MERLLTKNLYSHIGENVKIKGWIHRIRKMGKIAFLIIRDRSGIVQCVLDTKTIDIKGLKLESVVEVIGHVKERNAETSECEILVDTLNVISQVNEDLPVEINKEELDVNIDTLLNNRVLTLRHLKTNAIFKIQAALAQGFAEFLKDEDFTQVYSPKIVAEGTEGGTGLFELKYFEKKAYLAQSPQFYKQMLVGAGYERVFEIGHVYRAEEHNTIRHLNEYVSMDLEMGFIEDEKEIMHLETRLLKYIFQYVTNKCPKELTLLLVEFPKIGDQIPSMKLSEAIEILKNKYGKTDLINDLDPEGEKLICEYVKEKYNSDFIFLTHYPRSKRPMYTMPEGTESTHSFDLLFRGVEITTGGQRIHNYQQLKESISSKGLNLESFSGYLQVFKYGIPPHGGLAIGLERLTAQLLGLRNVREVTLFPRDRDRIAP